MRSAPVLLVPLLLLVPPSVVASPATATPVAPASPETLAHGERVMRQFCLSCHGSPGGAVDDPLGPRLRPEVWGDPERAYQAIGQLSRVNRRMDQPFTGPDGDRRALAAWLAWRAERNRESPLRRAFPVIGMVAGAVTLAAILLVVRRRGGRSPGPG